MADPSDSPRGGPAPYPTSSLQGMTALPTAPPPAETKEQREYQPVAILAIIGLGVAVLYALVMGVMTAVALIQKQPLILPGWTVTFPLVGGGLGLLAWLRVQRSEGTLSGRRLALAGVTICGLVGLVYWSYYLATFLAMRQRADAVAREWMSEVAKGNLNTGFWYTLDPVVRPARLPANPESDPAFHHTLEFRFNSAETSGPPLSGFETRDEVHLLRQMGQAITIESLGTSSWEPKGEGYIITQAYRVSGSEGSFDLEMTLQGKEAKHQEFPGRQWFIEPDKLSIRKETLRLTDAGKRALDLRMKSRAFVEAWMAKMAMGPMEDAYLGTRPFAERERLRGPLQQRIMALQCMLLATTPSVPGCGPFLAMRATTVDNQWVARIMPGFEDFSKGSLVHTDRNLFWITLPAKKPGDPGYPEDLEKEQDKIANDVKAYFAQPSREFMQAFKVNKSFMPYSRHENGHYYVEHQFTLGLPSGAAMVEGFVDVECTEEDAAKESGVNWRIAKLELLRAKAAPSAPGGRPAMPGAPGMPSPGRRGGP